MNHLANSWNAIFIILRLRPSHYHRVLSLPVDLERLTGPEDPEATEGAHGEPTSLPPYPNVAEFPDRSITDMPISRPQARLDGGPCLLEGVPGGD